MLRTLFWFVAFFWAHQSAWALESQRVYRCGNVYTNQPDPALHCKPLSGGNVTVVEGTRVQHATASAASAPAPAVIGVKVDAAEQRHRDAQALVVLQAELHKAQQQQTLLRQAWNDGAPERRADEFRQPQKYQDRVAQLRVSLQRADADVAGLQRELSRLSAINPSESRP